MNDPYCYDNGTLRNRFGLTDAEELATVEVAVTTQRIAELGSSGLPGRFDLEHLRAIHRRIFDDVYEWAGARSPRTAIVRRRSPRHTATTRGSTPR